LVFSFDLYYDTRKHKIKIQRIHSQGHEKSGQKCGSNATDFPRK